MKQTLARLRTERRVPNAMLFAGPDGVGKKLFAIEMARTLVCRASGDLPCGECPACVRAGRFEFPDPDDRDAYKKVIFSRHPDIGLVVAPKRVILVDAVRDLESEAHFHPFEGAGRTFIVDDADKMNDAASNALLKTLEEPAPTTQIILITSRPDSLLATIRSRCQTIRFSPVAAGDIEHFLVEKHAFDRTEAALAARVSRGSVGRAISIDATRFRTRRERMLAVVTNAIETGDRVALLRLAEEVNDAKNKEFFEEEIEILETLIHDIWSICVSGPGDSTVNIDIEPQLASLAGDARRDKLAEWLAAIQRLRDGFAVNLNRKMATDALFVRMAS